MVRPNRLLRLAGWWPALVGLALVSSGCSRGPESAADAPGEDQLTGSGNVNVVIYVIDTLRRDRLGLYGYEKRTSPNLDKLAREGFVFDRCYAPAPWTLPSVVSLLTSTYPVDHGVVFPGQMVGSDLKPLACHMKDLGYRTAAVVANVFAGKGSGLEQGYDFIRYEDKFVNLEAVEQWLDDQGRGPIFLYLQSMEPHYPLVPPLKLIRRFGSADLATRRTVSALWRDYIALTKWDSDNKHPLGSTDNTAAQRALIAKLLQFRKQIDVLYDASVAWADHNVGQLVKLLKKKKLWDHTLLIVVSDHGEELYEHGGWAHDQSLYEELVRVPMIWRFPDLKSRRRRIAYPANLIDLVPTLAEYLGHPEIAAGARGVSLMPAVLERSPQQQPKAFISSVRINYRKYFKPWKIERGDFNINVYRGNHKAIWNVEPDQVELYDLSADPTEQNNLAAERAQLAQQLRQVARDWLAARPDFSFTAAADQLPTLDALDQDTRERLRALGYIR